jgi:hypothetical protein
MGALLSDVGNLALTGYGIAKDPSSALLATGDPRFRGIHVRCHKAEGVPGQCYPGPGKGHFSWDGEVVYKVQGFQLVIIRERRRRAVDDVRAFLQGW